MVFYILNLIFTQKDLNENISKSKYYVYKRNERDDVFGGNNLDRFFVECVLSDCNDFTKEKNVQRAKILANTYNLEYEKIEDLYAKALENHEIITKKLLDKKLGAKRKEENEEYIRLNKYSNLYGKNKRRQMLLDRKNELVEDAKTTQRLADLYMRSTQQEESDWASWAGAANALGGAGAAVATAREIQEQNAQIRIQNEANRKAAMPDYLKRTNDANKMWKMAKQIQKELDLLPEKLISDMSTQDVMKYLEPYNATVEVSETGAFRVTASVKTKQKLFIYDDVPAVADGTLIAHVYEKNKEIGKAIMVLPVNGVKNVVGIIGMGIDGAEVGKKYDVKFTADKLWLIEE